MENIGDIVIERTLFTGFFTAPKEITTGFDGFLPMAQYYKFRPTIENTPDIYATKTTSSTMNDMIEEFGYGLAINQIDYFNEENRVVGQEIIEYIGHSRDTKFYHLYSEIQQLKSKKEMNQITKRRKK